MTAAVPSMRDQARRDVLTPVAGQRAGLLRRFINLNRRLAARIERVLPQAKADLYADFERTVVQYASLAPTLVVADLGGGRSCSFAAQLDRSAHHLVAVDISAAELSLNRDVDETRVADVTEELPFADGEVGLLVSRTLLEHVNDVEAFTQHSYRALAPGGYAVHLVPCRNAPFAVIARVVPFALAKWLLHFLRPETAGVVEFPAFYDRGTYSRMRNALLSAGFRSVYTRVSYYQSDYFDAFLPAYVLSALYELAIMILGRRDLAAYMLVVAQK